MKLQKELLSSLPNSNSNRRCVQYIVLREGHCDIGSKFELLAVYLDFFIVT